MTAAAATTTSRASSLAVAIPVASIRSTPASDRPGVRLTARGRRVLIAAVAALVLVLLLVGGLLGAQGAAADDVDAVPGSTVVVKPGESLWSIAVEAAPGADPRETVALIRQLNGLGSEPVLAGQQLVLPAA
jgi:hypothetical protein